MFYVHRQMTLEGISVRRKGTDSGVRNKLTLSTLSDKIETKLAKRKTEFEREQRQMKRMRTKMGT